MDSPMLFSPDHALRIAADAVGKHAQSTDMAVGIITGIGAAIQEWNRLVAGETMLSAERPADPPADKGKTVPIPAIPRPRNAAKVNA